jgi:hypothetical protein
MKICKTFNHLLPRRCRSYLLNSTYGRYLSQDLPINRDVVIKCIGLYCDDIPDNFRVEISTHWERFVDIKRLSSKAQNVDIQYNHMDANMELLPSDNESHPVNAVNLIVGPYSVNTEAVPTEGVDLQLVVPEYVDIFILAKKLDLKISNKVSIANTWAFLLLSLVRLF